MLGDHCGVDTSAHVELTGYTHEAGVTGGNKVVQHGVGDLLMKGPLFAEGPHVHLQRLQLNTLLAR